MKTEKTVKLLYRAASRLPYSGVIMARVLSDVKLQSILKKYGAGKPIVIICGEPGNGKTSSVRALLGEHREIKFVDGLKEVKKVVSSMTNIETKADDITEEKILFLDNFPEPLSSYKLEVGRRILDYVVDIVSENENAPITIITGEMNLVGEMKKATSLQERALMIKMNKINDDEELYEIRDYFSIHQAEYIKQWELYHEWALENPVDEKEILQSLTEFRKKYREKYENRQIGLVFCYMYAIRRFSLFLKNVYGEEIFIEKIEKNIQQLFNWKNAVGKINHSYEVDVWKEFLKEEKICDVYEPHSNGCSCLVGNICDEDCQYQCYMCNELQFCENYNPMELRLQNESAAILIEDPTLIPYFPKHAVCNSPLLIIGKDALLKMLNIYLVTYSRKIKGSVKTIAPKRFTKEMYTHNRCLFKYEGSKRGNAYTFRLKDMDNKDVRVLFIKLTNEEYKRLAINAKSITSFQYYENDSVKGINECLQEFGDRVQSLIGEVGTPSMIVDELD